MNRTRRWLLFACVLSASGCTSYLGWRPFDPPTPVKRRDLVWFWSGGAPHTWQGVVFNHDSISGIPDEVPLKCDTCRRSLPLVQVDSLRLAYTYHKVVPRDIVRGAGDAAKALVVAVAIEAVVCAAMGAEHDC